ncbi:MAG: bifunctional methylenetetrahydrofolate dehydrogenase/methenyltetrahydrofolate cyclohydrolase [Holosporaceae bacterium]|jgi:methylenetetrahydrofolate dehydrogenase (NADP+)/methenyltetrahydrofolate cyclohydrolase|nr:bifunctional methylenetetrahydrofolate dehydrogenase/methenyltetrahydrofolate cyclohydrolase [Holosporaceae bacterium]
MASIIDGKTIAHRFGGIISRKVERLKSSGIFPHIALINAGQDPASEIYLSRKQAMAESLGIKSTVYKLNNPQENDVEQLIKTLNADDSVSAILLQSPLMPELNFRKLVDFIDPCKDADGLTTINQGKLFTGEPCISPCTPLAVLHLIHSVRENISGLQAVVLGRSSIVGKPTAQLLLNRNCSVTLLHSQSRHIPEICATADIIVSAIGKSLYVQKHFIKSGAIVIDVGINRIEVDGAKKVVGDVDFHQVAEVAAAISPVPNGVGPMTVTYLMHNTVLLATGEELFTPFM